MKLVSVGAWLFTFVWGVVVGWMIFSQQGEFAEMAPNEWGDFLAGTVSPLALIWLVAGYLQQGKELKQNTEALMLQHKELAEQVRATIQLGVHAGHQVDISKAQHQFTLQQSEDKKRAQIEKRRRDIQPDIFLFLAGRDRSKWTLELKNKGGEAFQVEVFTTQFNSVKIFGDKARLATHESRTVFLNHLIQEEQCICC